MFTSPPEPDTPCVKAYCPPPPVAWNEIRPPGTVPVNAGVIAIRCPTLTVAVAFASRASVTSTTSWAEPLAPAV